MNLQQHFKKVFFTLMIAMSFVNVGKSTCDPAQNLQSSTIAGVSSFSWDAVPGAINYTIQFVYPGYSFDYPDYEEVVTTNFLSGGGITPSATFEWRILSTCSTGVSVSNVATITLPCPEVANFAVSGVTENSVDLSWVLSPYYNTNVSTFIIAYRILGSTGSWTSAGSTDFDFFTVTGLAFGTAYEFCINQTCPYFNSNPVFTAATTLYPPCNSTGINNAEWIDYFKLKNINRTSGAEPGGYLSTGLSTNLTIGSSYIGKISKGRIGYNHWEKMEIYIDYNQNNVFEANEIAFGPLVFKNVSGSKSFTFNVPTTAQPGTYNMRVIMARNPAMIDPCSSGFNGETEDYIVNLIGSSNIIAANDDTRTTENAMTRIESGINNTKLSPTVFDQSFDFTCDAALLPLKLHFISIDGSVGKLIDIDEVFSSIDCQDLNAGLYFVKLLSGKEIIRMERVIKL